MIYRQATKEDIGKVSELWLDMVKEMRPEWEPSKELWAAMGEALMSQEAIAYTIIVAEDNDKIVGFVDGMIFQEPSTNKKHGVGQHFYVMPEYRNTSTASRLYKEIVSEAVLHGAEVLEFFCFPEDLAFWRKRGFGLVRCLVRREINV